MNQGIKFGQQNKQTSKHNLIFQTTYNDLLLIN